MLAVGYAGAQTPPAAGVAGFVVDERDGTPLAGVLVAIRDGPDTDTDALGRFHLPSLRPGQHEIVAVATGCRVVHGPFTVEPGQTKLLKLMVPPLAEPPPDARGNPSGVVITALQLEGSRAPDLFEAIRDRVPLLTSTRGRGSSAFRGGGSGEVTLIVDGVRTSGSLERLRSIRTEDVARIEIQRSATAGTAYGPDISGGLVIVTTRGGSPVSDTPPERCRLPWGTGR
jgi:outer membrane cobalamin receptor